MATLAGNLARTLGAAPHQSGLGAGFSATSSAGMAKRPALRGLLLHASNDGQNPAKAECGARSGRADSKDANQENCTEDDDKASTAGSARSTSMSPSLIATTLSLPGDWAGGEEGSFGWTSGSDAESSTPPATAVSGLGTGSTAAALAGTRLRRLRTFLIESDEGQNLACYTKPRHSASGKGDNALAFKGSQVQCDVGEDREAQWGMDADSQAQ